jgi:hypothetical protein
MESGVMSQMITVPTSGYAELMGIGFRVTAYYSPNDAAPVIEVHTTEDLGEVRVYVNDAQVFAGDPEEGDRDG